MPKSLLCLLLVMSIGRFARARVPPSSDFIPGDTSGRLTISDFFVGSDGAAYFTGQLVNDSVGLHVSGVLGGERSVELFRRYGFEENGLFIRPYGSSHPLVCGYSEYVTSTLNVRLVTLTLGWVASYTPPQY